MIFMKCMSQLTTWPWKLPMTVLHMCSLNIWLRAMLDLWHCHRTSLWLCMNMKMSSKHLYTEHGIMFQTCIIRYYKSWFATLLLHDTRYVRKLFNLLCLASHGSHKHLDEGKVACPQTSLFVCLYIGTSHDQADAYPKASLHPGFNSIGTRMSVIAPSPTSTQVWSESV